MPGELSRDPELNLIVRLCRELAKIGLNVGMSDARPAAIIGPRARGQIQVTVDDSHQFYEWLEAGKQYSTSNPEQAAKSIAEIIKTNSIELEDRT